MELTGQDREMITRARQLADLSGAAAVREHTGDSDPLGRYVAAFGEAQHLLAELAALAGRLGGGA